MSASVRLLPYLAPLAVGVVRAAVALWGLWRALRSPPGRQAVEQSAVARLRAPWRRVAPVLAVPAGQPLAAAQTLRALPGAAAALAGPAIRLMLALAPVAAVAAA